MENEKKKSYFTPEEEASIVAAIKEAENNTSGEIKVHVEPHCFVDLLDRSADLFAKLEMHATEERNGVMIYIAFEDHLFSIIGDIGINQVIEEDFWDDIRDKMQDLFAAGDLVGGLREGVLATGLKLKKYFPYKDGDVNELSDDLSFG